MENSFNVLPATLDFDRSDFAAICRDRLSEAPLARVRCRDEQKPCSLQRTPLVSTVKPHSASRGFFTSIVAVLHTIASAKVGGVEHQTSESISALAGGVVLASQGAQDAGIKGFICAITGLRRRAVADADSSDPAPEWNVGTGFRTGSQVGDEPNPC
jgi:hypothetical protein